MHHFRSTFVPLVLMGTTPVLNIILWMINRHYNGSLWDFLTKSSLDSISSYFPSFSSSSLSIILIFAVVQALLLIYVPGATHKGPLTPAGNRPTYKLNGVACYVITAALLAGAFYTNVVPLALVYDSLGEILLLISCFAFVLCIFLYFKGLYFPSSNDSGSSGNIVWDFYWGTELHPQISNSFNLKQYCNCRLGMMGWHAILLCCIAKQLSTGSVSLALLASVIIQEVYIGKFFLWEGGYFASLDIMHDRFGYYICWGVLCWIAGVYTLVAQYLTLHSPVLSPFQFFLIVATGIFLTWANYDADAQRQRVRDTNAKCTVWGKPPKILMAKYKTTDGKEHQNILLLSGWWGLSRHAHYVTEILTSLMWSLPAGTQHALPYFYVVYLTVLLFDRSYRDEQRCRTKYGSYWKKYCQIVKYSVIPFVY
jgi:7-dehydrocholesterol reductase